MRPKVPFKDWHDYYANQMMAVLVDYQTPGASSTQ
jgi:hypothetical protein